jgi:uncharacterized protein (TIGR03435 family)
VVILPPLNYSGPLPEFEVASVKKSTRNESRSSIGQGGRATLTLPLRSIIMMAWNAKDFQIVGGPKWITSDRFTITAKAEKDAPRDQLYLMLRSLIMERFQLKSHLETRQMNTYVLSRPSPDSPLGPGLAPVDCTTAKPITSATLSAALQSGRNIPCGLTMSSTNGIRAGGITMASFASLLGSLMSTTVVDRTEMTGTYSLAAEFSLSRGILQASAPGETISPVQDSGGSVFSAVRDLGLRLERRREAVDVLVIDSIQQPDED